ncbi:MAG: hypothetical protein ACR2NK_19680 [Mariniblastus sp.]
MNDNPNRGRCNAPDYNGFLAANRVFSEVQRVAGQLGIVGDPLLRATQPGSLYEERLVGAIIFNLPTKMRHEARDFVKEIARNIVMSRKGVNNDDGWN